MAAISPSSSPRLPSPPPIAEDQIGPTSPGISLFEDHSKSSSSGSDPNASRRIRPGTKACDITSGPPLTELHSIDSPFPLTEHLSSLHHHHTHPTPTTTTALPASAALTLATPPPSTSREIHLYELARLLIHHTNAILIALFADTPPCSAATCPEMRASEWQYLCAVHDPPKSCAAIDYCCHTLDWAAGVLCNSKLFPSRLGLGLMGNHGGAGGAGADKVLQQQMKELTNIFRRVYRIFAHAWFQHREVFWRVEGRTGLYGFFKTVCDVYGLIQQENYTIPDEAAGGAGGGGGGGEEGEEEEEGGGEGGEVEGMAMGRGGEGNLWRDEKATGSAGAEPVGEKVLLAGGETTKRHRSAPSETRPGSSHSVSTTIAEEAEEEEEDGRGAGKPSLGRAPTVLKKEDRLRESERPREAEQEEEEPLPGVQRSETVKPESLQTDGAGVEESADVTVVEAEVAADAGEEVSAEVPVATEAGGSTVQVDGRAVEEERNVGEGDGKAGEEEMQEGKEEEPAAEAEQAGKSVED